MGSSAILPGADLAAHARALTSTWEAVMGGGRPARGPRGLVARSWSRTMASGLDPGAANPRAVLPLAELERRRQESSLAAVVDDACRLVAGYADSAQCLLVVTDADGVLLWREGAGRVRRSADRLGFVEGARWDEQTVGTNAVGTAIAEGAPVQLFAAEHFEQAQQAWYCTAAPIHDPRSGEMLGVLDISGPALTLHPMVTALVDGMVRIAEADLRRRLWEGLDRLRSRTAARLASIHGPVLLVDRDGWVAHCAGVQPRARVAVPAEGTTVVVPGLGVCQPEAVDGGWLIRPAGADTAVRLLLDLSGTPSLQAGGGGAGWRAPLTNRHAEILLLLHLVGPAGLSVAALSHALYGDVDHIPTVRAEVSRLRRIVGAIVVTRPYRLAAGVELTVEAGEAQDLRGSAFVRTSTAPGVARLGPGGTAGTVCAVNR